MVDVIEIAKKAKQASVKLQGISDADKTRVLIGIADCFENHKSEIFKANEIDLKNAKKAVDSGDMTESMYNRLKLNEEKLRDMIQGVRDVAALDNPVNQILWSKKIAKGITLSKISCPIGVIGVIFEARPDVIAQISSLALKSSDAVILKGGYEAENTNKTIFSLINDVLASSGVYPENTLNLIFSRDDVKKMLAAEDYIDLIIPRGSNSLVQYIKSNTKIPVLGHADGICHIYIDEGADLKKVLDVCIDSKCQYPSACNSVETVLIHEKEFDRILPILLKTFKDNGVVINSDSRIKEKYPEFVSGIAEDWHKEYGDKIVSLKSVKNLEEAIAHINTYGSGHTDCIITENKENAEKFMMYVDSAGVYHNISTRFADGFRYGFGAEVGISTNKTHSRGPVGLDGLTIYKYKLLGSGDIVSDFVSGKRKFIKEMHD